MHKRWINHYFETNKQKRRQQQSYFTNTTLVSYIFKLVLYFDWVFTNNQIKYYLITIRGDFLPTQCGFYRKLCFPDSLWLAAEWAFIKNSRNLKPGTWLLGESWWEVIRAWWLFEIVQVSLFLLTGEAEIANAQGSGKDWYFTIWS